MQFLTLLSLAGVAIGAAIDAAPTTTASFFTSTDDYTAPFTDTCPSPLATSRYIGYTSVCTEPLTTSTTHDLRDCAHSHYYYWKCTTDDGHGTPIPYTRHNGNGRCQGWKLKFARATATQTPSEHGTHPEVAVHTSNDMGGRPGRWVARFASPEAMTPTLSGFSPTRSNKYEKPKSTSSVNWSKSTPEVTRTRSQVHITNSPSPSDTWRGEAYTTIPVCTFNREKGEYDCPTLTALAVPACSFDVDEGRYVCPMPAAVPTCYFDVVEGEYVCPQAQEGLDGKFRSSSPINSFSLQPVCMR